MFDQYLPRREAEPAVSCTAADSIQSWTRAQATTVDAWKERLKNQDAKIKNRRRGLDKAGKAPEARANPAQNNTGAEVPEHLEAEESNTDEAFDPLHPSNPLVFARSRGLNPKQTEALLLVALAQLTIERGDPYPHHIFISGAAGCGKSVVLSAIAGWMALRCRTGQLRLVAPTGTAAANIKGMTLHSLLGFKRKKDAAEGEIDALSEKTAGQCRVTKPVREELANVTLVCCDEVGMVGHRLMNLANKVFKEVKDRPDNFGGVVTVWFGNFCQFAPVGDEALYKTPSKSRGVLINLWRDAVTRCIVLDQPMRQKADEVDFLRTLGDLRIGANASRSWQLLNERVVGHHPGAVSLADPRFDNALFVTTRHNLRHEYNRERTIAFARERRQLVFASIARYTAPNGAVNKSVIEALATGSPTVHGNCDAAVYLTIGMPVVLTSNLHTGQGVTNGAYATVTRIVLEADDERRCRALASIGQPFVLRQPPRLVLVRMKHQHNDLAKLRSLEVGEVPITPEKGRTALLRSHNYGYEQIPLSGAFAVTDYCAQGAMEKAVIVDLVTDGEPGPKARAASYVAISRVTTLDGLAILRDFRQEHLGKGDDVQLKAQLLREREVEAVTRAELAATVQKLGWR
ncbi:hypothetical protein JCM8097_007281 [Rhodosporidiobolus ruineniae]